MFLAKIVFAVLTCTSLINYVCIAGQDEEDPDDGEDQQQEEEKPTPLDNHTFVALIDILFTNGRKRSCTGTIIHDNVVITAAHCFVDSDPYIMPELTASFVVIGTKKMFDTGYENYLPIERVMTHPNYKGWTADIALVFTFAGMTSDKPGNIIPLVGERTLTPVDSNVTVLSWGHCKDEEGGGTHTRGPIKAETFCDSINDDSCEEKQAKRMGKEKKPSSSDESSDAEHLNHKMMKIPEPANPPEELAEHNKATGRGLRMNTPYELRTNKEKFIPAQIFKKSVSRTPVIEKTTKFMSRYLPEVETTNKNNFMREKTTSRHRYYNAKRNRNSMEADKSVMIVIRETVPNDLKNVQHIINTEDMKFRINKENSSMHALMDRTRREEEKLKIDRRGGHNGEKQHPKYEYSEEQQTSQNETRMKSYFKNWRRQMGSMENKLTVDIFGFVNVQTCRKIVEKAMPAIYGINPNHVVCYATEEHYITDEDSGAPAIRQGHLVAVTVGGVACEGDHVAIGMKMSCFCDWIAENLPDGGENMKCCKDCCNGDDRDELSYNKHYKHKNKYLYK